MREIEHGASETARRYVFDDGIGEIGIIAPVSMPFCGHCSRVRLTSDGKIRTCLFSVIEHDLYGLMRRGASDERLAQFIIEADQPEGRAASHRRAGFCAALAHHGAHRGISDTPTDSHICQMRADMGHRCVFKTETRWLCRRGHRALACESCTEPGRFVHH